MGFVVDHFGIGATIRIVIGPHKGSRLPTSQQIHAEFYAASNADPPPPATAA
jgi:hypothetical protein